LVSSDNQSKTQVVSHGHVFASNPLVADWLRSNPLPKSTTQIHYPNPLPNPLPKHAVDWLRSNPLPKSTGVSEAVKQTSMDEISSWLEGLKLGRLLPIFKDAEFESMEDILYLTDGDMEKLGVKLGPRRRLARAIKTHKASCLFVCRCLFCSFVLFGTHF
jgi:hypothetical protein